MNGRRGVSIADARVISQCLNGYRLTFPVCVKNDKQRMEEIRCRRLGYGKILTNPVIKRLQTASLRRSAAEMAQKIL